MKHNKNCPDCGKDDKIIGKPMSDKMIGVVSGFESRVDDLIKEIEVAEFDAEDSRSDRGDKRVTVLTTLAARIMFSAGARLLERIEETKPEWPSDEQKAIAFASAEADFQNRLISMAMNYIDVGKVPLAQEVKGVIKPA